MRLMPRVSSHRVSSVVVIGRVSDAVTTGNLDLERRAGRVVGTLGAHRFELDDIAPGMPSYGRWFVHAVANGTRPLVLDLRAVDRAAIYIAG